MVAVRQLFCYPAPLSLLGLFVVRVQWCFLRRWLAFSGLIAVCLLGGHHTQGSWIRSSGSGFSRVFGEPDLMRAQWLGKAKEKVLEGFGAPSFKSMAEERWYYAGVKVREGIFQAKLVKTRVIIFYFDAAQKVCDVKKYEGDGPSKCAIKLPKSGIKPYTLKVWLNDLFKAGSRNQGSAAPEAFKRAAPQF